MKYALLSPHGNMIRRVLDAPRPDMATTEITDEQAATVAAGFAAVPRVPYFLIDGELRSLAQAMAIRRAALLAERAASMTPEEKIRYGEQFVEQAGFSAARLVTLMDLLLQTKEANALGSKPKLVALYTWLQTVKGMAIAGQTAFPPAPHTFEEVVSE